jgi:hypothetical protein
VRGYLETYRKRTGGAMLIASHNMAEVERLCDQVLMLRRGRIVDRGTPAELLRRYGRTNLEEVRHVYILRGSWPRILELAYWPTIQMIIWGFITLFLATNSSWVANAFGVLLSAVLLWDVLFRGQLGFSLSFLEEMYSRNLASSARCARSSTSCR